MRTAQRLRDLPAAVAPDAEDELVAVAGRESLKALQDDAARRKVAHLDEEARGQRIHDSRHVRFGTDAHGAASLSARTTVDAMAEIKAAISHYQTKIFDAARRAGRRDPFEAYAADGLLAVARAALTPGDNTGLPKRIPTKIIIRVDHPALVRGQARPGERCEITGTGPVPVREVASLLASGEAFTALVATDPRGQVTTVAHLGHRNITQLTTLSDLLADHGVEVSTPRSSRRPDVYQQTALDWTTPTCAVAGCDQPRRQIDHRADWADTHHTTLDDLDGYCPFHHTEKTRNGPQIPPGIGRRQRYDTTDEGPAP